MTVEWRHRVLSMVPAPPGWEMESKDEGEVLPVVAFAVVEERPHDGYRWLGEDDPWPDINGDLVNGPQLPDTYVEPVFLLDGVLCAGTSDFRVSKDQRVGLNLFPPSSRRRGLFRR